MNQEFIKKLFNIVNTGQVILNDQMLMIRKAIEELIGEEFKKTQGLQTKPNESPSNTKGSFVEYIAHDTINK